MARKVFFSFKYEDVQRAMVVRNSNVIKGAIKSGFIDAADFEAVERKGDKAIQNWIDGQFEGTSVTVVLIGSNTAKSRWVKYEIAKSISRGNGILTIDISKIGDFKGNTSECCDLRVSGYPHYLWFKGSGAEKLGEWVEKAAKDAGK